MNNQSFIKRYNNLAAQLVRTFSAETPGENIIFSPFSILSMLSILSDATGGNTREEVLKALYGRMKPEGLPEWLQKTGKELSRTDYDYILADLKDFSLRHMTPDYSSHMKNASMIFIQENCWDAVRPEFAERFKDLYDGMILAANDLGGIMEIALGRPEHGDMKEVPDHTLISDAILELANTVSFDAMWMTPYADRNVKQRIFKNCDRTESKVNMMYGTETSYIENEYATGFIKDFQQCQYSFMALLPKEKSQEALQQMIGSSNLPDLMNQRKHITVHTAMPEFTIESEQNLKQACADLGITEALTTNADFTQLTTAHLPIKRMSHHAKIKIDRNGASAASATMLKLYGSLPPQDEKEVILNRPFAFAIFHRSLNIPVFMGSVSRMEDA